MGHCMHYMQSIAKYCIMYANRQHSGQYAVRRVVERTFAVVVLARVSTITFNAINTRSIRLFSRKSLSTRRRPLLALHHVC